MSDPHQELYRLLRDLRVQRREAPEPSRALLDAYAKGKLEVEDSQVLEQILEVRPDLRMEIEVLRRSDPALQEAGRRGLEEGLRRLRDSTHAKADGMPGAATINSAPTMSEKVRGDGRRAPEVLSRLLDYLRSVLAARPVVAGGALLATLALISLLAPQPPLLEPVGDGTFDFSGSLRSQPGTVTQLAEGERISLTLEPSGRFSHAILFEIRNRSIRIMADLPLMNTARKLTLRAGPEGGVRFMLLLYLPKPMSADEVHGVLETEAIRGRLLSAEPPTERQKRIENVLKLLKVKSLAYELSDLYRTGAAQ